MKIKNEKIERYLHQNHGSKAELVKIYLSSFVANYGEFEEVLADKDKFSFGNGMKKYERLSAYIAQEHDITWLDGQRIDSNLVRNLYKLARRENEANQPKRKLSPELDTVFRIYHPDDSAD